MPTSPCPPRRAVSGIAGLATLACCTVSSMAAQAGVHAGHAQAAAPRPAVVAVPRADAPVPLLATLGTWTRPVTASASAQPYFDQGLRWYYGFNHDEAVRAFREAQRLDPDCAMCAWGEALALGPNMNAPMDEAAERQAVAAARRAGALVARGRGTPVERAWVGAVEARYLGPGSRAARDSAYARAMAALADAHAGDADALVLAAEAAMDLSPWVYWGADGSPLEGTAALVTRLERAIALAPDHPGACHFFIHAVEDRHPARALPCADRLARLMPGAGHLVHMPAHVYVRTGRWADAIEANHHAIDADHAYLEGPRVRDAGAYTALYAAHNHHFLTFAAVMAGARRQALAASREVGRLITPAVVRRTPMVEVLLPVPVQTLVTFGEWAEALRVPLPPPDLRFARGLAWHARGVAFAALDRPLEARASADSVRRLAAGLEGEPATVLELAAHLVTGAVALRRGDAAAAVAATAAAVALEDGLSYMEPPTWFHPARHALGKALLAAGRAGDAVTVYEQDLARFPENAWSLTGLAQALRVLGRDSEAEAVEARRDATLRLADGPLPASRY